MMPRLPGAAAMRRAAIAGVVAVLAAMLTVPVTVPHAAGGEPDDLPFVQLRIDKVTPDMVTTTSEPVVTVVGKVANTGDRPVHDVMLRLEHAAPVASSAGLRTNLDGADDQFRPADEFVEVADELQRGQDVGFALSAPVRSAEGPSLEIDRPGIYPILVNVNGTPDYGTPARLDDARFLLPVLGVPRNPAEPIADPQGAVVAPDTSAPVGLTMLWPLADRPRLTPGVPGGTDPVRLIDDELADSLTHGGRLDTLLSAAEFATNPSVDPDGAVRRSLCLTVDPDLLVTVNAMTTDYVVADTPDDAAVRPGTGRVAATTWLERLRSLARHLCVTPSPYAQADLDAVQRVGDEGLSSIAVAGSEDVVDRILGVPTIRGATVLANGPLTGPAVDLLSAQGEAVAITAADCSAQNSTNSAPPTADTAPRRASAQVVTAPFDPAVGAALGAVGNDPIAPTYLDSSLAVRLRHASTIARRQDALGAMLWRALEPSAEPRIEILSPPTSWAPQADDAYAILTMLTTTIRAGLAVPRPLTTAIVETQETETPAPAPAADEPAKGRFDADVVANIAEDIARLWGLTGALSTDARTGLTGAGYTAPLREDLLRALSQSVPPAARNGLAHRRLELLDGAIDGLFSAVTIVNPGGAYTLATEHSPLPLALRNDLAVPIRVRLQVDAPAGMSVTDLGEIELPPGYLPLRVPVEVRFNQRVAVDVVLHTPDGLPLGEPVRLSVHANAYGKALFALTLGAAAVLVALTGRRLWHRFRGQPDPADLDRPEPPWPDQRPDAPHDADKQPTQPTQPREEESPR